jgi:hypothetical protein
LIWLHKYMLPDNFRLLFSTLCDAIEAAFA